MIRHTKIELGERLPRQGEEGGTERHERGRRTGWCGRFGWWLGLGCFGVIVVLGSMGGVAQEGPGVDDPAAFEVVVKGNIFDPNRGAPASGPESESRSEEPAPRSERIVLTGVLISETNAYGFFDGTESDYRKVVALNKELVGLRLTSVTSTEAVLTGETNEFRLRVSDELERVGDEPWRVVSNEGRSFSSSGGAYGGSSESPRDGAERSSGDEAGVGAPSSGGGGEEGGGMSDALKRLLEKRRKEAGQ